MNPFFNCQYSTLVVHLAFSLCYNLRNLISCLGRNCKDYAYHLVCMEWNLICFFSWMKFSGGFSMLPVIATRHVSSVNGRFCQGRGMIIIEF